MIYIFLVGGDICAEKVKEMLGDIIKSCYEKAQKDTSSWSEALLPFGWTCLPIRVIFRLVSCLSVRNYAFLSRPILKFVIHPKFHHKAF